MLCKIIPENCIACGLCQLYAPDIFDYDDTGTVLFKKEPLEKTQLIVENKKREVLSAYRKCPVYAIEIIKENSMN